MGKLAIPYSQRVTLKGQTQDTYKYYPVTCMPWKNFIETSVYTY